MIAIVQRVSKAAVHFTDSHSKIIGHGLVVLLGIEDADEEEDVDWLTDKIIKLRIFDDEDGKMNLPLTEVKGKILVISQFTLHASTKKGSRPSYIKAAKPDIAMPLYEKFLEILRRKYQASAVESGIFGAYMRVELINDGPVTIHIDTKNKK